MVFIFGEIFIRMGDPGVATGTLGALKIVGEVSCLAKDNGEIFVDFAFDFCEVHGGN